MKIDFAEMQKIDLSEYIQQRDGFDYVNWARIVDILHKNGAKTVFFTPIRNPETNSSLFYADKVFGDADKKGAKFNSCYEVGVHIVIDDLEFDMWGPLTNGSNPVQDNSLTQSRVWSCQTRLFVKGVALMTGLGFNLWLNEEEENEKKAQKQDDIDFHDIKKIKERIERRITALLDRGASLTDIAKAAGFREEEDVRELIRQCVKINNFEVDLAKYDTEQKQSLLDGRK